MAGNRNQVWKVKQEQDLLTKILLVAHRIKRKAGEPGSEPRHFGGGLGYTGASKGRNDLTLLMEQISPSWYFST